MVRRQQTSCIIQATLRAWRVKSMVRPMVESSSSAAAMTSATSAHGTAPCVREEQAIMRYNMIRITSFGSTEVVEFDYGAE
ncbi:hypothetical protein ABH37_18095 [Mycobacterium haemophilum]|uniref:Uncharacterized protein n=1 Tax=Mycobacterium haemophilum TaxID=29311 RepID=A0A0I9ZQU9_9MYCO|nr:hypothetical protein ABH38_07625 [Mycobacterium haemophilum]KLO39499.1 hypothetical protein ABH37_18095 [Mycobacterium haemophilum]KLO55627.1 hypothetical protein ABH36_06580 [Mycobacterium haemophilum]